MTKDGYPLQQVLQVKQRRVEEAEKVVNERQKSLEKEEERLRTVEEARDKVLTHKKEKLAQLREAMDTGSTSVEITQMKRYLDLVKEKLVDEEKKVAEQQKQVDQAKRNLEEAKVQLRERRIEVDKLELHKTEWAVDARKEMVRAEGKAESEVGQQLFLARKRQESKRQNDKRGSK